MLQVKLRNEHLLNLESYTHTDYKKGNDERIDTVIEFYSKAFPQLAMDENDLRNLLTKSSNTVVTISLFKSQRDVCLERISKLENTYLWEREKRDWEKRVDVLNTSEMLWELHAIKEEAAEVEIIQKLLKLKMKEMHFSDTLPNISPIASNNSPTSISILPPDLTIKSSSPPDISSLHSPSFKSPSNIPSNVPSNVPLNEPTHIPTHIPIHIKSPTTHIPTHVPINIPINIKSPITNIKTSSKIIKNSLLSEDDFEQLKKRVSLKASLVGAITYEIIKTQTDTWLKIYFIGIRFKYRGKGIGTFLLNHIMDKNVVGPYDKILAYIFNRESILFWKKNNFRYK